MKFSYNWLKEFVPFKEGAEELAEFLTLRAFEVESVEKKHGDWVLDVKLLPNRVADASSHIGLSREIAALKGLKIEIPHLKLTESKGRRTDRILGLKVASIDDCPRYIARVIGEVRAGPSPAWLKSKIETCGLSSINNLVDAANFVMLETGQPLHIFDFDKIENMENQSTKSKTIMVRRAKQGEKIAALDGKTYDLNQEILVIADQAAPIAIAGIKGGTHSGVSNKTKTVILESANFNPARIRTASQMLGLKTDASYRFKHGLDPNACQAAIDRLAALIEKLAGGKIFEGYIDFYPRKSEPNHVPLRVEYSNRLIGTNFPPIMYETALKRLDFNYTKKRAGEYHVEPPTTRKDIEREEDLIEEIVKVWGYDKIQPQKPFLPLAPAKDNNERYWEDRIKDFLAGAGFTEVFRYLFTGETELKTFMQDARNLIEVMNPLTPDQKFLADSPLPSFIRAAKENELNEDSIRIFGITRSFKRGRGRWLKGIDEKQQLAIVMSEGKQKSDELFLSLKGAIDELLDALGVADHWYDEMTSSAKKHERPFFHPYRAAEIKVDDKKIGVIGEVHPHVRETLKAKRRIVAAELDVETLITIADKEAEFIPVSRFPSVIRDIAAVLPEEEKTERVTDIIENIGGKLLIDSDLFDYFQDEAMKKGRKKSLAFHLIFQSKERTLTDDEVDKTVKKIVSALEEKGWRVRK